MSRKKSAPRCKRQGQDSFSKNQNKAASHKTQSPWADSPAVDHELDDVIKRSQSDADRLEATCADDAAWFEENPARRFRIREVTPHERDTGLAPYAVLVTKLPGIGRARIALELYWGAPSDYDNDAVGEVLFDECMRRLDPDLAAIIRGGAACLPRSARE